MKKLKVLLVSEYFPPKIFGGGEISAYNLAKSLAEKRVDVFVLTTNFKDLRIFEEKDGFKIIRTLKTGNNPSLIIENLKRFLYFQKSLKKEILKIDKKENFDVVHFLNTTSIPSFKINKKTIATINGYTNFCPKRNLFYKEQNVCSGCSFNKFIYCILNSEFIGKTRMKFYLKYNPFFWLFLYFNYKRKNNDLKNINKFIAISDFIKYLLLKNDVKERSICKIPNIVDINKTGKHFDIKEKGIIISYVGSLEKAKGVEMLVKAFNKVDSEAKLLIFGSGSQRKYLEKISNENIKFFGSVDYKFIPSIYKQTNIFVQPALWPEPLSRVMIEALFFGKPIIATNNGGNIEGVIDGKNGFLINSEKELKEKMGTLIKNYRLRKKMGLKSKKLFEEKFENITSRIRKLYKN